MVASSRSSVVSPADPGHRHGLPLLADICPTGPFRAAILGMANLLSTSCTFIFTCFSK